MPIIDAMATGNQPRELCKFISGLEPFCQQAENPSQEQECADTVAYAKGKALAMGARCGEESNSTLAKNRSAISTTEVPDKPNITLEG